MTINDLNKMVDHEIQWLSYYSTSESRSKLSIDSNIYSDLNTMGYCKTPTPLYFRCSVCLLSNGSEINELTDIESLVITNGIKDEFKYTPLETFIKLYPHQKQSILDRLIPKQEQCIPYKSPISSKIPKDHK